MSGDRRACGRRGPVARVGVQSRAGGVHAAEGAVAAQSRARRLRPPRHGAPRQGFRSAAAHRRARHGAVRCVRDPHVRPGRFALVSSDARGRRPAAFAVARGGGIVGNPWSRHRPGRSAHGSRHGHAGGGWRSGQRVRGGRRRGNHAGGGGVQLGDVGDGPRPDGRAARRPGITSPHVLSRGARCLVRDGRRAVGGGRLRLVS